MTGRTAEDIVDAASLFRALQRHKTDDLDHLTTLLADPGQAEHPVLLDLCAGIGRTVPLALRHGWDVVCVDSDGAALATAAAIDPARVFTRLIDLASGTMPEPPTVDAVICAHHAANEVGSITPLFELASRALVSGGWFYLELLTGTYPRPFELEYVLRIMSTDEGGWTLDTVMVPLTGDQHELTLVASHHDPTGRRVNQIQYTLTRTVFPAATIARTAREFGFHLEDRVGNRHVFRRARTVPQQGGEEV